MRRTPPLARIALGATILVGAAALAAGIPLQSRTVGAGAATVGRCDTDGVSVVVNLSGTSVVSATVGGIASPCGGKTASVTVSGAASSSGTAPVPAGGGSLTISLAAAVPVVQSMRVDLAISGP